MTKWISLLTTAFLIQHHTLLAQDKIKITGLVADAQTKEPLEYATIGFLNSSYGTVSGYDGSFQFQFPAAYVEQPLVVSYLGHESKQIKLNSEQLYYEVLLAPQTTELNEVIVRPMSPQEYIKRVVKSFPEALPTEPYGSHSYYQELLTEDGEYLSYTEGVFKSYYPDYQDTVQNQHQLLLYRKEENPKRIEFMRDKIDKEKKKEEKKADKKGEEYEDPERTLVESTFGGPNAIFNLALSPRRTPAFLDSTQFKEYKYEFAESTTYGGKELLNIQFEAKHPVDHQLSKGNIYIDLSTNGISLITMKSEMVIPALIKPLLFLYGLSVNDFYRNIQTRYQLISGRWYPEYFYYHVQADLKKRHVFDDNEKSFFEMEILIKMNEIDFSGIAPIPEEQRFQSGKKISEQVHNTEGIRWEDINTLAH